MWGTVVLFLLLSGQPSGQVMHGLAIPHSVPQAPAVPPVVAKPQPPKAPVQAAPKPLRPAVKPTPKPRPLPPAKVAPVVPIPTVLSIARSDVGKPASTFGCADYWCACYVESVLTRLGWKGTTNALHSPWNLYRQLPEVTDPRPGDLAFFTFDPRTQQPDHVAIVESLNPLVVIDGNGYSAVQVGRWTPSSWTLIRFARYGN